MITKLNITTGWRRPVITPRHCVTCECSQAEGQRRFEADVKWQWVLNRRIEAMR